MSGVEFTSAQAALLAAAISWGTETDGTADGDALVLETADRYLEWLQQNSK